MTIKSTLRNIGKGFDSFTQARALGYQDGHLPASGLSANWIFTRTLMASITGDYLFEVGAGRLDPVEHTKLLMQYAYDSNRSLDDVRDEYLGLLKSLGFSQEPFRRVVAGIVGANERAQRVNGITPVTPTFIHRLLTTVVVESVPVLLLHMMTDYVCHMLRPLGWIVNDAPYVYWMRRSGLFPRYLDLVNVVSAADIRRTIQSLADADLSIVKAAMDKKSSILPAMVSQHLASAVVVAYELSQGTYDAEAIVRSVLTAIGRTLDPNLVTELRLKDRVRNHPAMAEFKSNLALVLAYQDMIKSGIKAEILFSDEEMAAVVLPLFQQALAEVSPFSVRILEDVVSHIGKRSTKNHMGQPGHVVLFEDWEFSSNITAFIRVRQSIKGNQAFLRPQPTTTAALSTTMRPVRAALDVKALVDHRLTTYELAASSERVPKGGTQVIMAMPSLVEEEIRQGLPSGTIAKMLTCGSPPDGVKVRDEVASRLRYDYFAMIAHLAVAKAGVTSVMSTQVGMVSNLYLTWTVSTFLKEPVGDTAILGGVVVTTEPLEALAYSEDFSAVAPREAKSLPVEDFTDGVHIWDWYNASIDLSLEPAYGVTVRNRDYLVGLDEHELLGLGVKRKNIRFMRPVMATAVARIWLEWLLDDDSYIASQIKGTKDTLVQEGFRGRQIQNAMQIAATLTSIGSSGAGANAISAVYRKIADEMYGAGNIDDYSELHVGVQRHRLHIWAGLVTLQLLGVIDTGEVARVIKYLSENDALSLVVGTIDLPLQG